MAKQDFPSNIDRRCLLIWTAAFAAYSIAPNVECAEAASLTPVAQPLSSAPEFQGLDVCAATARRLLEIEYRNEIRREALLPRLSIPKELRRMKTQEVSKDFELFGGPLPIRLGAGCEAPSGRIGKPKLEAEQPGGHVPSK